MNEREIIAELAKPIARELLESVIPARLAYVGLDGAPRVVPVAYVVHGGRIVVGTLPNSAKVPALRKNPKVSITIDTEGYPPRVLLLRGVASVELVDGVPDEYVAASLRRLPESERAGWEQGVRALYERMALISIELDWAKLLDFETTVPKAVEELVRARQH